MASDSTYLEYRDELNGSRITQSARVGALVVFGLNTGFILLDWWAHPAAFRQLLAVRLAWDVAMVGVYWGLGWQRPLRVMLAGLYLSGLGMLSVIGIAGGVTSSYWPGMMILFLGIPVMLPLSVRQSAAVVSTLTAGFVGLPLFSDGPMSFSEMLAPIFFVSGAAIECIASTAALERLRLTDFIQRQEIESARDHLKEMDQVKARFTANIHHELRTPLTLTLAPLEGLLAGEFGPISEKQRSYMKTMRANALRLLRLINNLLDLAKVESGQLTITRRPVDVAGLVAELVEGAKPLASKKNVDLSVVAPSQALEINVDPEALEKVVLNLLGNALKFTGSGDTVSVVLEGRSGGGIALSVSDSGVGLEAGHLSRIFDRFAQVDTSATRRHEGTGIGLSLSKELVELHGGRIWAESAGLGRGAIIRVDLPKGVPDVEGGESLLIDGSAEVDGFAADVETSDPVQDPRNLEIERSVRRENDGGGVSRTVGHRPGAGTVLVCEDNHEMRRLLCDLLSKEFNVRLASNGEEGLQAVTDSHPDVVLTDVMMPVMSGIELCERLKASSDTAGIPVVLVTSKAERDMKIEGLEKGADDYVTKPFHSRELIARVRSLVRLRQLQESLAERNTQLESALSDLKQAEAKMVHAERLAAVGDLAAGIAHEVNNPVNFARNAAQAMASYIEDCRQHADQGAARGALEGPAPLKELKEALDAVAELAGIVADGLARTGKLVGDLRDFAAPWKDERAAVDLVKVVDSARQLTGYAMQKAGVSVDVDCQGDLPSVYGDARAIGQVMLNLLKNAAEAFEKPGGSVTVTLRVVGRGVEVAVADDGPGMDAEVLEHLFEPFFTTKGPGHGTGLGLSICRQVVAEHGGSISVSSERGRGTEFVIWLPLESAHV